jgi:hypothetical protein
MRKIILFVLFALLLTASNPLVDAPGFGWHDVFEIAIVGLLGLAGSPLTQLFKNMLKIDDRWAVLLTVIISGLVAVLELWLTGVLDFKLLNLQTLPNAFFAMFTLGSIYFGLFKNSQSVLGRGYLLKKRPPSG